MDVHYRGVGCCHLYSGDDLVAEYDSVGTMLKRYVPGLAVDGSLVAYDGAGLTARTWYHTDELGSIIATSDGSGTATPYAYGPYGEPANDNWAGPRFRYTGQIALPEVKLYHYKARAYDPAMGRFLQTDPVGYEAGDMNLYAYVANDPVNGVDPMGMAGEWPSNGGPPLEDVASILEEGSVILRAGPIAGAVIAVFWPTPAGESPEALVRLQQSNQPTHQGAQTARANPDGTVTGSNGRPINTSTGGPGAGKRFNSTPDARAQHEGQPCTYCGKPMTTRPGQPNSLHEDHGVPRSQGGNNTPQNNNPSCATCNLSKGAKDAWEWVKHNFGY